MNENLSILNSEDINRTYNDLPTYFDYVNLLARTNSKELIPNGLPEHARIICSALLSHAENEICIFSGNLRNDIYGEDTTIDALKTFLSNRKRKIKIILQDIDDPRFDIYKQESLNTLKNLRRFIDACITYASTDQFEIRKCSDRDRSINKHFAIMDETGYRYCPDKGVTEAIACFNDKETALHLKSQFDILFERATEITNGNSTLQALSNYRVAPANQLSSSS